MAYVNVEVDVDLSMLDDEDIRDEYTERFGSPGGPDPSDTRDAIQAIYHAMRMGHKDKAYDLMWDYVRDVLGTAV